MNWITSSEQLIHEIAGDDLEGQAVYLIPFAWVASHEPRLRGGACAAWTSPLADLLLHSWLSSQGRWHGRGFATVLHADQLPTVPLFAGAVLHELGHYLTFPPVDSDCVAERSEALVGYLPLRWAERSPVPIETKPLPRWRGHGSDFVRACCHLAHRVESVIESVRPSHIRFVQPYYRGFVESHFMQALGSELERTGSIREILDETAPKAFTALWQRATA